MSVSFFFRCDAALPASVDHPQIMARVLKLAPKKMDGPQPTTGVPTCAHMNCAKHHPPRKRGHQKHREQIGLSKHREQIGLSNFRTSIFRQRANWSLHWFQREPSASEGDDASPPSSSSGISSSSSSWFSTFCMMSGNAACIKARLPSVQNWWPSVAIQSLRALHTIWVNQGV